MSSEGVLRLVPLLACDDAVVREGIRAYLAERHEQFQSQAATREAEGWTSFQWADQLLQARLNGIEDQLAPYRDRRRREGVLNDFHRYAYQWF